MRRLMRIGLRKMQSVGPAARRQPCIIGDQHDQSAIMRQRDQFTPRCQNWFRSALPWVTGLGAVHKNEKQA